MKRKTRMLALAVIASAAAMSASAAPASAATSCYATIGSASPGGIGEIFGYCTFSFPKCTPFPGEPFCYVAARVDVNSYLNGSKGQATGYLTVVTDGPPNVYRPTSCTAPQLSSCYRTYGFRLNLGKTARGVCLGKGALKTFFITRCSFVQV